MMNAGFKRAILASVLLLGTILIGAAVVQAQEETPPEPELLHLDERARVRVVNGSLQISRANVYINGTLYFQETPFRSISSYIPLPDTQPITRTIGIRAADSDEEGFVVESQAVLEAGHDYTIVLWDTTENIAPPWVVQDENRLPLRTGQAGVRVVRVASENTPAVEICLDKRCGVLTTAERVSNYIQVEPRTYGLSLRLVGAETPLAGVTPITFKSGEIFSLFVFDPPSEEALPQIIPYIDTKQAYLPTAPGSPTYSPIEAGMPQPYPPANPEPYPDTGQVPPPLYPPITGAFLSPAAWAWLVAFGAGILMAGGWLARKRYRQHRNKSYRTG